MPSYDLMIAALLAIVVIVVFLISRMKLLPSKSIPYLVAGGLAVVGVAVARKYLADRLNDKLKEREKELKEREKDIERLRAGSQASETELRRRQAELEVQREAFQRNILELRAQEQEELRRVQQLDRDKLNEEFIKLFPGG
jgi:Skp family chaperone for outer membrane proteins